MHSDGIIICTSKKPNQNKTATYNKWFVEGFCISFNLKSITSV